MSIIILILWGIGNIKWSYMYDINLIATNVVSYERAMVPLCLRIIRYWSLAISWGQRKIKGQKFKLGEKLWTHPLKHHKKFNFESRFSCYQFNTMWYMFVELSNDIIANGV